MKLEESLISKFQGIQRDAAPLSEAQRESEGLRDSISELFRAFARASPKDLVLLGFSQLFFSENKRTNKETLASVRDRIRNFSEKDGKPPVCEPPLVSICPETIRLQHLVFGTIHFGCRNVKIESQNLSWNCFWAPQFL